MQNTVERRYAGNKDKRLNSKLNQSRHEMSLMSTLFVSEGRLLVWFIMMKDYLATINSKETLICTARRIEEGENRCNY